MPFSTSLISSFVSSISGVPPQEHPYYEYFVKVKIILKNMANKIGEIEASYLKYFSLPQHDWTIMMRKFYKIEHVLKIIFDIISFINNSLKKEKIEETSSIEDNIVFTESFDKSARVRKDSEQKS
jgi:hypothetical protein